MVRASKGHKLGRKYKKWRKGKSEKASNLGSIKNQIRGQQRLLQKVTDEERKIQIQNKIEELQQSLERRERTDKEKHNARKSHGIRFVERQKLVRQELSIRNQTSLTNKQKDIELFKIALDMVYVAHYPHDQRYISLFLRERERVVDPLRTLARRGTTRKRIIANLNASARVDWISEDMYNRVPSAWSIQLEKDTFGQMEEKETAALATVTADSRFQTNDKQQSILEAMSEIETRLDSESDTSSDDAADPLMKQKISIESEAEEPDANQKSQNDISTEGSVSSGSSSDTDSESTSSSSVDDSDIKANSSAVPKVEEHIAGEMDDSNEPLESDDFFATAAHDSKEIFLNAKRDLPTLHGAKGDKSQGWSTQRQRPGQFKRKKQRF